MRMVKSRLVLVLLALASCTNQSGGMRAIDDQAVSDGACPRVAQGVDEKRESPRTPKEVLYDIYNKPGGSRKGSFACQ